MQGGSPGLMVVTEEDLIFERSWVRILAPDKILIVSNFLDVLLIEKNDGKLKKG